MSKNSVPLPEGLRGRSVFSIETVSDGVLVKTVFITEGGEILHFPAVFPNQAYALSQLDELRAAIIKHFTEAARVGVRVIAQNALKGPGPEETIQ